VVIISCLSSSHTSEFTNSSRLPSLLLLLLPPPPLLLLLLLLLLLGELVEARVRFSVNGVPVTVMGVEYSEDPQSFYIPKDEDIYPTLTLHSPNTQVLLLLLMIGGVVVVVAVERGRGGVRIVTGTNHTTHEKQETINQSI